VVTIHHMVTITMNIVMDTAVTVNMTTAARK